MLRAEDDPVIPARRSADAAAAAAAALSSAAARPLCLCCSLWDSQPAAMSATLGSLFLGKSLPGRLYSLFISRKTNHHCTRLPEKRERKKGRRVAVVSCVSGWLATRCCLLLRFFFFCYDTFCVFNLWRVIGERLPCAAWNDVRIYLMPVVCWYLRGCVCVCLCACVIFFFLFFLFIFFSFFLIECACVPAQERRDVRVNLDFGSSGLLAG